MADATRLLRAADVFALRFLAEVAVSPDGSRVACVERRVDERLDGVRSRVLVVDVATGDIRSLSPDDALDSAPRWIAEGARLAFSAARGTDGSGPRVADAAGGSGQPWPGVPAGAGAFAVAPGGDAIAIVVARDDAPSPDAALWEVTGPGWHRDGVPTEERHPRASLWRVDADGRAVPLTAPEPGVHDRAPAWSPDGRWVAFLSDRPVVDGPHAGPPPEHPHGRPTRLWLVAADGTGAPFPVVAPATVVAFAWSPWSDAIGWLGGPEPALPGIAARLWITTLETAATREVPLPGVPAPGAAVRSDDPRGMGDAVLAWTAPDRLWLRWADGGASRIGHIDLATGALLTVVGGDRAALAFGVSADGRTLAHVTATADHPGELAVAAADGGGEQRLTDRNGWLREVRLGTTRRFTVPGPGGLPLEGWVVEPPAGAPRPGAGPGIPAVLSVHGGPHYPIGWRFSFESHRIAARGYALVNGNARGSTGYGDAHATAIHGDWGGHDLGDSLAILEAALRQAPGAAPLDPARVAITGVSYGGYLTMWAIANGDRFRAAIAENGISDLASTFGSAEDDGGFWIAELGATPWSSPAAYVDRSPLFRADRITTPLLLLHAEQDHNCPIAQSEELYSALVRLGRPVRFLRVRDAGHLMNFFGSGRFRLARAAAIDDWLDRWLAPARPDEGGDR